MGALSIRNVRKAYGPTEVLKGINIEVEEGEFLILVGPSGCGKSTLLSMIAGLDTITSGEVHIGGRLVNRLSPKDRDIAMVFQSYALYPNMTVRENISFGLEIRKVPKDEQKKIVDRVAQILQMDHLLDRKPSQLSGGQRQRVAMGRAIARNPTLFLFDEPLSNLDAKLRVEMRTEIKLLHQRVGKTIVYVTHDQIEAMTMADTIVVMNGGRVEQTGAPGDVYRHPATRFVATFIGSPAMNLAPARVAEPGVVELSGGRLNFDAAAFPVEPGRQVEVGIRPEDLQLAPQANGAFAFTKDFAEELGATRLFHGMVGDAGVVVALSGPAPEGTSFGLSAAPGAVHLFDPASGNTLRRA
jgi:multiple sugar transport system ATP-binding protein